ncbi:MAG TPA: hypothetical protein V6D23_00010 [Candidatus Obscuribacterales bacterium]
MIISKRPLAAKSGLLRMGKLAMAPALCLALLLSGPAAVSAAPPPPALGEKLAQKLDALGSFQADYRALSPDSAADITVIFNRQRGYALARVSVDGSDAPNWIVLDFAQSRSEGKAQDDTFKMLMISAEGIQRFSVSFQQLFGRLDNPLGAFWFFSQQLTEGHAGTLDLGHKAGALSLTLGLSETNLSMALAISTGKGSLLSSWLAPDTLATALDVLQAPEAVKLTYPDNHLVSIDPATGLLLLDQWPDPGRPGPREIRLVKQAPLARDLPYQELVPGFDRLNSEELPGEALYSQFYPGFLNDLGHQLANRKDLEQLLKTDGPKLTAKLKQAARGLIHDQVRVDPRDAQAYAREVLLPAYSQYQKQHQAQSLTFQQFLPVFMRAAEADPDSVHPPGADERMESLVQQARSAIGGLPPASADPLVKLYDLSWPGLAQAWKLELLAACLEQAASMEIEE